MVEINYLKLLPRHAFTYWPTGDYVKISNEKSSVRFIFYKTDFTPFELSSLQKFKSYLSQQSLPPLPTFYTDPELLRILLGSKFNFKKAFEALQSSIQWRSVYLQQSFYSLLPLCEELLNSGSIYFHGRDHRFRPLLVINIERLNLGQIGVDSYCHLLCFLLEFGIQKLMMPGQIENWVVITDLCSTGIGRLPISEMKRIIKVLQDNFRCRMAVNYVLNSPSSVYFLWRIAKGFIEEHTIKKIRIEKKSDPAEIFLHFNRGQVERKYGGTAPNATQFWPPIFPEGPFEAEGDNIDEYFNGIDTYHEYIQEEKSSESSSEVSSYMGSISEKFQINIPNSFLEEEERCEAKRETHRSDYWSLNVEEGVNRAEVLEGAGKSMDSRYSIGEVQVLSDSVVEEIDENMSKRASVKSEISKRASVKSEISKRATVKTEAIAEPNPPRGIRRICKFCSVKRCVIC